MNKKLLVLICLVLSVGSLCMGKKAEGPDTISVRRAFIEMPTHSLELLSRETRQAMLEYAGNAIVVDIDDDDSIELTPDSIAADSIAVLDEEFEELIQEIEGDTAFVVYNEFDGEATIDTIADNFLAVRITDVSSMQFKVLPLKNGDEILMTIYSVGGKNTSIDSDITFYDAGLQPLETKKYFQMPKLSDFFDTKGYSTKMKEIEEMLPFYTVKLEADPDNTNLKATLTYSDRLTVEDAKIIELFLKPALTYVWDGSKYKLSR